MTSYHIEIDEHAWDKNSVFWSALKSLKNLIQKDESLSWSLQALWSIQCISERNLAWKISKKTNTEFSQAAFAHLMREYKRETWKKLSSVKSYKKVCDSKIYLLHEADEFYTYALNKLG